MMSIQYVFIILLPTVLVHNSWMPMPKDLWYSNPDDLLGCDTELSVGISKEAQGQSSQYYYNHITSRHAPLLIVNYNIGYLQ